MKSFLVQGYAAAFHSLDSHGDIILPGAFTRTIEDRGDTGWNALIEHCTKIGRALRVAQADKGLYVFIRIDPETEHGQQAIDDIKLNLLQGISIGYKARKHTWNETGNRVLQEIDLLEISLVKCPSNALCRIIKYGM